MNCRKLKKQKDQKLKSFRTAIINFMDLIPKHNLEQFKLSKQQSMENQQKVLAPKPLFKK